MKSKCEFRVKEVPKIIALSGGPGVGKTSIIHCLQKLGYPVREEVFTRLFAQAQNEGRFTEEYLHSQELIHELISAQMKLENQAVAGKVLFLDRSRIDIWGFAKNMGITPHLEDQSALDGGLYDFVFMIEPMPKKFYDQNMIRRQNYEESLEHHEANVIRCREYLEAHGQDPQIYLKRVPFFKDGLPLSAEERTQHILGQI